MWHSCMNASEIHAQHIAMSYQNQLQTHETTVGEITLLNHICASEKVALSQSKFFQIPLFVQIKLVHSYTFSNIHLSRCNSTILNTETILSSQKKNIRAVIT